MGIGNLFRPKHRHSDPDVRARAVRELSAEQASLIVQIAASDEAASVRKVAINQLHDPRSLVEVARAQDDASLRKLAHGRAVELWIKTAVAEDEAAAKRAVGGIVGVDDQKALAEVAHRAASIEVRQLALASLSEPKALAELARGASSSEVRLSAVARIDDGEVLRSIAVDEQRKAVGFAALERITDPATLEQVATKAKNKQVRNRARKKLGDLAPPAKVEATLPVVSESQRRHAERAQLVRIAQGLADGDELETSAAEMAEAVRHWDELGDVAVDGDAKLEKRFHAAVARYEAKRARHVAEREAAEAKARKPEPPPAAPVEEPAPVAAAESAESAPSVAPEQAAPEPTPAPEPAPDRNAEREARERRTIEILEGLCKELEAGLSLDKLKAADRLLSRVQRTFDGLKLPKTADDLAARYEEARNKLFIHIQELREVDDWQRWANVPKCEALIARAEALLADEEGTDLGKQLQELQAEWKQSSSLPRTKADALWDTFKVTCDKIYERVRAQRGQQDEERKANLRRKEELCEQAELLSTSTEWTETAEKIKQLQAEWKAIGPAPRRQADAVWKRFRGACDRFFEARKPHLEQSLAERTKNLEAKQKLCEQAEALADSTDWVDTGMTLRRLQREWREIGPAPRKEGAEIAKRFRVACDKFFQRREADKKAEQEAEARRVQDIADEIEAVRKIAAGEADGDDAWIDGKELAERTLAVRTRFLELAERDQRADVRDALAAVCLTMVELHADAFAGTELDPGVSRTRKEKLVARAEELAPDGGETPAAETPEQIAERLRAALASNALGVNQKAEAALAEVAELQASWQRLGPVPGTLGAELEDRFRRACERTTAAYR